MTHDHLDAVANWLSYEASPSSAAVWVVSTATRIPSLASYDLQPPCHIAVLGIYRIDLHLPAALELGFDSLHQAPLPGVDKVFIHVAGTFRP